MEIQIKNILQEAKEKITNANNEKDIDNISVEYLGKQGKLTSILRGMKEVAPEQRKDIGILVNNVRDELESLLKTNKQKFENELIFAKLQNEKIDITEPATEEMGTLHPIHKIINQLVEVCVGMGFTVVSGPEVETDYYNFEALNVPKNHPARDMQDTFYLSNDALLRTQTSSVQARVMEKMKPPLKIVSPGKTYRADSDATHSPVFHQIEGLVIDENVSMVDLKAMLTKMLKMIFGESTHIRFRPSFFPFTEPSVEVDVSCPNCDGKGCTRCKQTGYMELLGAGMVNPKVLENCGIDSSKYNGFAFGTGLDRLAMVVNKIPDLRMMFENDIRFLKQMR